MNAECTSCFKFWKYTLWSLISQSRLQSVKILQNPDRKKCHPVTAMTLELWRKMPTVLQGPENMKASAEESPPKSWDQLRSLRSHGCLIFAQLHSKHAPFSGRLCCFSNNPKRRLAGCLIMNKTADGDGFVNLKYHMWSQNVLFIPWPDASPTHTGLWKKYMTACWPRTL